MQWGEALHRDVETLRHTADGVREVGVQASQQHRH